MLLNIFLSNFQQYRTLLAKVIQFFVSPEKCKNQRYEYLTPHEDMCDLVRWLIYLPGPGNSEFFRACDVHRLVVETNAAPDM